MIDLVIINPSASHGIYGPLGESLIAIEPPLWCRLLAGYIRSQGFSVKIIDGEAVRKSAMVVAGLALAEKPRLICIAVYGHQPSASTQQMWGAREVALELQELCPTIMIGGHPSALPVRTLNEEPVDFVGVGEGHLTLAGLLRGDDIAIIPGLAWRDGAAVRLNKSASLCENLAELHGDTWDLLPMNLYRAHNWQCFGELDKRQPYASIYTSLGCPWKCEFCCINAPFDSNRYRMRKPADVAAEIAKLYYDYGVSTLKITDEMFVLNRRHYSEICQLLINAGLGEKLNIWAYARVDTVEPGTLDMLRRAGIRWLALGIESGSAHVRDGASKRLRTNDIIGTVRRIQAAGINVIGNFMFGLRDDTAETMQETLDLSLACMPDFANFYATMAYPGSALYREAIEKGWTLPKTFAGYSQHNKWSRPLDTAYIDGAEVLAFRDAAFQRFFTDNCYLAHVANKFGSDTLAEVKRMTQYKLERLLLDPVFSRSELETNHQPIREKLYP